MAGSELPGVPAHGNIDQGVALDTRLDRGAACFKPKGVKDPRCFKLAYRGGEARLFGTKLVVVSACEVLARAILAVRCLFFDFFCPRLQDSKTLRGSAV